MTDTSHRTSAAERALRRRLLSSGAMPLTLGALALAGLLSPAPVKAQGFQGTGVVVSGSANISQAGTSTDVSVTSNQVVINWTPSNTTGTGNIDFLPVGQSANFGASGIDFTVLNRIIPVDGGGTPVARVIELNGTVSSFSGSGNGGNVWFYSPGGILVGANAAINVGGLVLTTRDIDTSGGLFGTNGEIRFRNGAETTSNSAITIAQGAQITRTGSTGDAYVAMVAPRIVQAGTVTTDGTIALVAAEAADITINNGQFDIVVTTGSDDSNGLVHSGTSGGVENVATGQVSNVYLVAIPKNQAMTMLLSGTVGFTSASGATTTPDGQIILSAGFDNITGGVPDFGATNASPASIQMGDINFRNNLSGYASDSITARSSLSCSPSCSSSLPSGGIWFGGDTNLIGRNAISMSVGQAQIIDAANSLSLTSRSADQQTGGLINLGIDTAAPVTAGTSGNGQIKVGTTLMMSTSGIGDVFNPGAPVKGGTIAVSLDTGTLDVDDMTLEAGASTSITGSGLANNGASGTGGSITFSLENGAVFYSTNYNYMNVDGFAAEGNVNGGVGQGGTILLTVGANSSLGGGSGMIMSATGVGAAGNNTGGAGIGGSIWIAVNGLGGAINDVIVADVSGYGGGDAVGPSTITSLTGGVGQGGTIDVNIVDGSFISDFGPNLISNGHGAAGSNGIGGNIDWTLDANATGSADVAQFSAEAIGYGANGDQTHGAGNGIGGAITFTNTAGPISGGNAQLNANGQGGSGYLGGAPSTANLTGGNGTGGTVTVNFTGGSVDFIDGINAQASGIGGDGGNNVYNPDLPSALLANNGGIGTGGTLSLNVAAAATGSGNIRLTAQGAGGNGGGTMFIGAAPVTPIAGGNGGNSTGGNVTATIASPGYTSSFEFDASASGGSGGSSTAGGNGGIATGGNALITVGANLTSATVSINAAATGGSGGRANNGSGGNGGDGGAGHGGLAQLIYTGAGTTGIVDGSSITATGFGGRGGDGGLAPNTSITPGSGGRGGTGTGGTLLLGASDGGTLLLSAPNGGIASLVSAGFGGTGGRGADASDIPAAPDTQGGTNGRGGNGVGGSVELRASGGTIGIDTSSGTTGVAVNATGTAGSDGLIGNGPGGNGAPSTAPAPTSTGGAIRLVALDSAGNNGLIDLPTATLNADGDTAGRIELRNTSAGTGIVIGTLDASANGTATASTDFTQSGSGILIDAGGGVINITGDANLGSSGAIGFYASNGGTTRIDGMLGLSAGSLTGAHSTTTGSATLSAAMISAMVTGDIMFQPGTLIVSDSDLTLQSNEDITFAGLQSGGTVMLGSTGMITGESVTSLGGDGVHVQAGNGLALAQASAAGNALFSSSTGPVTLGTVTSGGDTTILASGDVNVTSLTTSGGGINSSSANILIETSGGVTLGLLNANEGLTVTAAALNGASSQLSANGDITLTTSGSAQFGSANTGATLNVASGDSVSFTSASGSMVDITAQNGVTGSSLSSLGDSAITSTAGSIALTSATAGGSLILSAVNGNVSGQTAQSGEAGLQITAGNITYSGLNSSGALTLNATGAVNLGSAQSQYATQITAASLTAGQLTATNQDIRLIIANAANLGTLAAQNIAITAGTLTGANAALTASGNIGITTSGNAQLGSANAGGTLTANSGGTLAFTNASGSSVSLSGQNGVTGGNVTATGSTSVAGNGGAVNLASVNANGITLTGASLTTTALTSSGNLSATTGGNASLGTVSAAGPLAVTAGGQITATSVTATGANGVVTLAGQNGINVGSVNSSGSTTLTAQSGALQVAALTSANPASATGRSVTLAATGPLSLALVNATAGNASVTTSNGALNVADGRATGALSLTAGNGALTTGTLAAGDITLSGASSVTVNGTTTATNGLTITAPGLVSVNAPASARVIAFASGDIAIGGAGRLGMLGTTSAINLRNSNSLRRTYIGGNDNSAGFSLSAAEISRLFGDAINVTAPVYSTLFASAFDPSGLNAISAVTGAGSNPDVIVDSFTLNGNAAGTSANLGPSGVFTIQTPGTMRVIGAVNMVNMTATNGLTLSAGTALEVIMGQGSVRLTGATSANGVGGSLSGILRLVSDNILVATSAAITDIAAATTPQAIEDRLAQNDGLTLSNSPIAAAQLQLDAGNGVFIQNSAALKEYADRRGFLANSLAITTRNASTQIFVNGQLVNAQGMTLNGLDAIAAALINGTMPLAGGRFVTGSTFNGCNLSNVSACRVGFTTFPVQDVTNFIRELQATRQITGRTPAILIDMRAPDEMADQPMLDEPITGAGNDDLWVPVVLP